MTSTPNFSGFVPSEHGEPVALHAGLDVLHGHHVRRAELLSLGQRVLPQAKRSQQADQHCQSKEEGVSHGPRSLAARRARPGKSGDAWHESRFPGRRAAILPRSGRQPREHAAPSPVSSGGCPFAAANLASSGRGSGHLHRREPGLRRARDGARRTAGRAAHAPSALARRGRLAAAAPGAVLGVRNGDAPAHPVLGRAPSRSTRSRGSSPASAR